MKRQKMVEGEGFGNDSVTMMSVENEVYDWIDNGYR